MATRDLQSPRVSANLRALKIWGLYYKGAMLKELAPLFGVSKPRIWQLACKGRKLVHQAGVLTGRERKAGWTLADFK